MPHLPVYRRLGYTRRRDDVVAGVVARILRHEGLEAARREQPNAAPASIDRIARVGGRPAAIEVTRLLPPPSVRAAQNLVAHIEIGAQSILRPAIVGIGGQVVVALTYSTTGVAVRRRDRLAADTRTMASRVRQTMNRLVGGADPIVLALPIPWVVGATVTLDATKRDGFHIAQSPDDGVPDLDAFVARIIAARAADRTAHEPSDAGAPAVLAIDARFPDADELRAAFARSPVPVPWVRVYHVQGSVATLISVPAERPTAP